MHVWLCRPQSDSFNAEDLKLFNTELPMTVGPSLRNHETAVGAALRAAREFLQRDRGRVSDPPLQVWKAIFRADTAIPAFFLILRVSALKSDFFFFAGR